MSPGRELDALVAEKVMKTFIPAGSNPQLRDDAWIDGKGYFVWEPPPYSTDIAAAWQVVGKLIQRGVEVQIHTDLCGTNVGIIDGEDCLADITEKEAPFAISLAALKAVGYEPMK